MIYLSYIERNGLCLTPCPFEVKREDPFALEVRKVGSAGCKMCRMHFRQERGFVFCKRRDNFAAAKVMMLALLFVLSSCGGTKTLPVTERRDSIVVRTELRVDSVWRDRWHTTVQKGDTVFVHDSVYSDRWHILHRSDTVRMTDTVPVVREVPVVVRRRNGYDLFVSWGFWVLLALVIAAILICLKKIFEPKLLPRL